jgi:hypothetical protein
LRMWFGKLVMIIYSWYNGRNQHLRHYKRQLKPSLSLNLRVRILYSIVIKDLLKYCLVTNLCAIYSKHIIIQQKDMHLVAQLHKIMIGVAIGGPLGC